MLSVEAEEAVPPRHSPTPSRVLHCSVDDLRLASRFIALLSRDSGPQLGLHAPATAL